MISPEDAMTQIRRLGSLGVAYNAMPPEGLAELATALTGATSPYDARQIIDDWMATGARELPTSEDIRTAIRKLKPKPVGIEEIKAKCQHCSEGSGWVVADGGVKRCEFCRPVAVVQ